MSALRIPTAQEAEEACACGLGNPLHEIIEWYRPKNDSEKAAEFGRRLVAAIEFALNKQSQNI